jgi:hypothetical protein
MGVSGHNFFVKEFFLMSSAANYNITINQNADYTRTFQVKTNGSVTNISGHSFAGKIKQHHTSTVSVDFTTAIVDASAGTFSVTLTDTTTATLTPGIYEYDIVMTDGSGIKTRLLQGTAEVVAGIV